MICACFSQYFSTWRPYRIVVCRNNFRGRGKGQTSALYSIFSFGHVFLVGSLQLQPQSQALALHPFIKHQKEMLQKRVLQHLQWWRSVLRCACVDEWEYVISKMAQLIRVSNSIGIMRNMSFTPMCRCTSWLPTATFKVTDSVRTNNSLAMRSAAPVVSSRCLQAWVIVLLQLPTQQIQRNSSDYCAVFVFLAYFII